MPPRLFNVIVFAVGALCLALGLWLPTWGPRAWGWLAFLGVIAMILSVAYWLAERRQMRRLRAQGAFDSDDEQPTE